MPSKVTELGDLLDDLPDALLGVDRSGAIRIANRYAESLFGYGHDDLVGLSFETLVPGSRPQVLAAYERRLGKGTSPQPPPRTNRKLSGVQEDGTRFPVDVAWSTLATGGDALAVAAVRDMSRYERAETKRRRVQDVSEGKRAFEAAQAMIETSLDSLVAISPEGKITDANEATVRLTGVPREDLIGTSFSDYFTDPGKAEEVYQRVFKEGQVTDYPLTLRHQDGHETRTEVRYNASVYRDSAGEVRGVFAAARDVTAQMQVQREMAEQQAAAQERLEELERFQRLTVGRELRMIQLKKEIEHLKRSNGNAASTPGGWDQNQGDMH
jgi:PAS domain S-box-containing protein